MKLKFHTDFALRLLMSLAAVEERLLTIEELATRHRLSRNHLMKVAQTLVSLGYVTGVRGRAGGLRAVAAPALAECGDIPAIVGSGAGGRRGDGVWIRFRAGEQTRADEQDADKVNVVASRPIGRRGRL